MMFCFRPVKKLSRQTTSAPSDRSRSQRCEPMKPAPPVTRILIGNFYHRGTEAQSGNKLGSLAKYSGEGLNHLFLFFSVSPCLCGEKLTSGVSQRMPGFVHTRRSSSRAERRRGFRTDTASIRNTAFCPSG